MSSYSPSSSQIFVLLKYLKRAVLKGIDRAMLGASRTFGCCFKWRSVFWESKRASSLCIPQQDWCCTLDLDHETFLNSWASEPRDWETQKLGFQPVLLAMVNLGPSWGVRAASKRKLILGSQSWGFCQAWFLDIWVSPVLTASRCLGAIN